MLSDEQITQFKTLYKKRFNKNISREEACEQGEKLIQLIKLVYKPLDQEEYKKLKKADKNT